MITMRCPNRRPPSSARRSISYASLRCTRPGYPLPEDPRRMDALLPRQTTEPYVHDLWHLKHPPARAKTCPQHGLVASAAHDKGGRWQVRGYIEGHQIPAQSYADRFDADARVLLLRGRLRDGAALYGPLGPDITLGQLVERFLRDSTLNLRTLEGYGNKLRTHVLGHFGAARKVRTIRRKDIVGFRTWLKEHSGLRTNSQVSVFAVLSAVLTAAIDVYEAHEGPNPCLRLRPRSHKRKPVLLTWEELERLAAAITPRYAILIWIVALAGLRPAEAFGLTIDRVRFLEGALWIEQQVQNGVEDETLKTKSSYADLPVDRLLLDKIAAHWSRWHVPVSAATAARRVRRGMQPPPASRLLVLNRCGRPVQRNDFHAQFRLAADAAGLDPRLHFHDLKHFYTSALAASGHFDPKTVQALSRHRRFSITWDTYAHPPVVAEGVRVTAFTALARQAEDGVEADCEGVG
ncbi:integrase [Streptacidiphilus sp. MAP12-16]|uniref:tyrosine-type recombinase/integrase n=1 Tax=Streptacidiphilus sp. MAP12-16 TaxID=3156300 RepID=UPI0035136E2D